MVRCWFPENASRISVTLLGRVRSHHFTKDGDGMQSPNCIPSSRLARLQCAAGGGSQKPPTNHMGPQASRQTETPANSPIVIRPPGTT